MNRGVKVAVIVTSLSNKGPIRVVQSIVSASSRLSLPVNFTVFYLKQVDELTMDCPVVQYHSGIDLSAFDVVHTHGIRPDAIGFWRRRHIRCHMVTIHNFVFKDLTYEFGWLLAPLMSKAWVYFWRKADLLVAISNQVKEHYRGLSIAERIISIHNGIGVASGHGMVDDKDLSAMRSFRSSGKKTIGTACVVTARKGIDMIIAMLARRPDLQFVLVGEGKALEGIRRQASELKVSDQCFFLGYRSDASRYFKLFDVFAIPSRSEGFGLTILEAARERVPIVCSDIPTFRELFEDGEVSYFQLESVDSLSSAIDHALVSRELMTASAWKRFHDQYTDDIMARRYVEEYQRISNP